MKLCVVGTGYVGLVSGTCFAEMGHDVVCIDVDREKITDLQQGKLPIYEPGLEEMVRRNLAQKSLHFSTEFTDADVFFIAVGTPTQADGSCDLSYVFKAVETISASASNDFLIVIKSTVPPGTSEKVRALINTSFAFDVVSNPEFLREGKSIDDFLKPDRIIIGATQPKSIEIMKEIYAYFNFNHERMLFMDSTSAELTKYACNAMLATRISFMNEMALLSEKFGANIDAIRKAMGADHRIGHAHLYPGPGYGGSCFPKDLRVLSNSTCETPLLDAVEQVNHDQKKRLFHKVAAQFNTLKGKTIGILGVAFKANTDDVRESSALVLITALLHADANVRIFDPEALSNAKKVLPISDQITYCTSEQEVFIGAHAVVLMTEWNQFRNLDFAALKPLMQSPIFFDFRNQYNESTLIKQGFNYICIGKRPTYAAIPQYE